MLTPLLDIQLDLEFDTIEAHQRKLVAPSNNNPQLRLAQDFKHWRVGGQAALIHLLSNWAVRFEKPQLVLWAKNETEAIDRTQNLWRSQHGLVALMAASDILLEDRTRLSEETSRMLVEDMLASMFQKFNWSSPKNETVTRGTRTLFLCSHHRNEEFSAHLYHRGGLQKPEVRNALDFGNLFSRVFDASRGADKTLGKLSPEVQGNVGEILHELLDLFHKSRCGSGGMANSPHKAAHGAYS